MKKLLVDPLFIFVSVWTVVFVLFSLRWSAILLTMDASFRSWSLVVLCTAFCGYVGGRLAAIATYSRRQILDDPRPLQRAIRTIVFAMAVIVPLEIVVSGGLPILWRLQGNSKIYTDYGIPTLHGFFNALLLFVGTVSFWFITSRGASTGMKLLFLFCIVFPVLAVTRQVLVSLIVQCLVVFIGARLRSPERVLARLAVAALVAMAAFAAIGDFRTSDEGFYQQAEILPQGSWMPPSIAWHYMYLTTPVNNFLYMTQTATQRTHGAQSLATLTPTVVRKAWFGDDAGLPPKLVKETFNVTSYATPLFLDFGWIGVIGFTLVMFLLAGFAYERFLERNDLATLIFLAVIDQIVLFTFFVNFLLTWGVLFQLFLVLVLHRRLGLITATVRRRKSRRVARRLRILAPAAPKPFLP